MLESPAARSVTTSRRTKSCSSRTSCVGAGSWADPAGQAAVGPPQAVRERQQAELAACGVAPSTLARACNVTDRP